MTLAFKPSHYDRFAHEVAWFRKELDYQDTWVVAKAELGAEIGTRRILRRPGGPQQRGAAPGAVCLRAGPSRRPPGRAPGGTCPGHRPGPAQRRLCARHQPGESGCGEVLLATNGYTTNVVPAARRGIFPVGSYIIVTEPLALGAATAAQPARAHVFRQQALSELLPVDAGRAHVVWRTAQPLDQPGLAGQRPAHAGSAWWPSSRNCATTPITHTWTGKLGLTFDLMPHIGRVEGVHYAYGYAGHGVAVASALGKEAGEMLAGHTIQQSLCPDSPCPVSVYAL